MTYNFTSPLIDLIEFGRHNNVNHTPRRFSNGIVFLAIDTIRQHIEASELRGIELCLKYQLKQLSWRTFIFGLPIGPKSQFANTSYAHTGEVDVIAHSIMATVLNYYYGLKERGTGLDTILAVQLHMGLGTSLDESIYSRNFEETAPTFNKENITKLIR